MKLSKFAILVNKLLRQYPDYDIKLVINDVPEHIRFEIGGGNKFIGIVVQETESYQN